MAIVSIIVFLIFLQESKIYNLLFRYFLYKYYIDFKNENKNEFSTVPNADQDIDTDLYIDKIKDNGFFSGDFVIS